MTVQEEAIESALNKLDDQRINFGMLDRFDVDENHAVTQALEEIKLYRALGTVEELKEAREKKVAKKPTHYTEAHPISQTTVNFEKVYQCKNCHSIVKEEWNFCTLCGQALDWSGEDD